MNFKAQKPREIKCSRCSKIEIEKAFGTGFDGWNRICEITNEKGEHPFLCPSCMEKITVWINGGKIDDMV